MWTGALQGARMEGARPEHAATCGRPHYRGNKDLIYKIYIKYNNMF